MTTRETTDRGRPGCRAIPALALAGAVLIAVPGPVRAQQQPPSDGAGLTLAEAVNAALATHPSVKAAAAEVEGARARSERAGAERWPRLGLRASATRYQDPMLVTPIHGFAPGATPPFDETLLDAGAFLEYTLYDFGARGDRARTARLRVSAARASRDGAARDLVAEVAGAYLEVLGLREVLAAHDRRIAALKAERSRVDQLRDVGRAARVERLRVEARLATARSDREGVRADLAVATAELARLTGVAEDRTRPERLAAVRWSGGEMEGREALTRRAAARNPAVERARRERAALEASLGAARSSRWPELNLAGSWVDRGSLDGEFEAQWSVGLGLSVPLFTGGAVTGEIRQARAQAAAAEERVRLAESSVGRAVDRAHASVTGTTARAEALERAVAAQEEVVRIEKLRLEAGVGTQTDYLDAEAELLSARAGAARTRFAALRARVELARVTGSLDPSWIIESLEVGT